MLRRAAQPLVVGRGRLTRARLPRTNDYKQAGERYLLSEQWEKDDLVENLVGALAQCNRDIQERMVWHLFMCEDELQRAANLGKNGPRDVRGLTMTHCVPNARVGSSL